MRHVDDLALLRGERPGALPHATLLFHALFAIVLMLAWASLASQLDVLIGARGLLPAADDVAFLRMQPWASFWDYPSLFWWDASDAALHAAALAGFLLATSALLGVFPRACFVLSALLYASFVVACGPFTQFQWDAMLIEASVIAAFMPRDRRTLVPVLLARLLLFKLYLESGIAKLESPAHDWTDGTAMSFYYETAPLPSPLAFYAHHLPAWWHWIESQAMLVLELVVPFALFGPRKVRYGAALAFTVFQVFNLATASYGFFVWMSLVLHVTVLADDDVERLAAWLRAVWPTLARLRWPLVSPRARLVRLPAALERLFLALRPVPVALYLVAWSLGSLTIALVELTDVRSEGLESASELVYPTHLANPYHLFTRITTHRIEPQLETTLDGATWTEHDMRWKPGDPMRAPSWVAPHQPRVDFRLWFYGLAFRERPPPYVDALLERACHDPAAIQPLYVRRLPRHPRATRIELFLYHFASREEHARTGAWWTRRALGTTEPHDCEE